MGHLLSTLVDTSWETQNIPLLLLPDEPIIRILIHLASTERKNLRLTCKKLAHDVREFVGSSDFCRINHYTPSAVVEFYAQSAFRSIEISKDISACYFAELFHRPQFLKEFRFLRGGVMSPRTAIALLQSCRALRSLVWNGRICSRWPNEQPPPPPQSGAEWMKRFLPIMNLPKLETLYLNYTKATRYGDCRWYDLRNSGFLLSRLVYCAKLRDVTLVLSTIQNGPEQEKGKSQFELAAEVYSFLLRNVVHHVNWMGKPCVLQSLKIYHKEIWLQDYETFGDFALGLCGVNNEEDECKELSIPVIAGDLRVKNLLFSSELKNYDRLNKKDKDCFETHMLKLVIGVRDLEKLQLKTRGLRPVKWALVSLVVANNCQMLVHLELTSFLQGPISFEIFQDSPNLQFLKIERNNWNSRTIFDEEGNSPLVVNFGPHMTMVRKLKTLILTNLGLHQADLYRLKGLKNLKHLVIDYWQNECGCQGVTFDIIKSLLHIRSLDSLYLLQKQFRHENYKEMECLEQGMHKLGFNYVHDRTEDNLVFAIASGKPTPFWTYPFHIPEL